MTRHLLTLSILASTMVALADDSDPAAQAARRRQDAYHSVLIEYRQVSRVIAPAKEGKKGKESSRTSESRLLFDGSRFRLEDNTPGRGMFGALTPGGRTDSFDGQQYRALYPRGGGAEGKAPLGIIFPPVDTSPGKPFQGLVLAFRGADRSLGAPTLAQCSPTEQPDKIDGDECLEYQHCDPLRLTRYWVDPTKDYVVRKIVIEERNNVARQSLLNYRKDDVHGWLPTGWRNEYPGPDGTVPFIEEATVTRLAINEPVEESTFRIEFPPGAHVTDQSARRQFRILEDGEWQEIDAEGNIVVPLSTQAKNWAREHPVIVAGIAGGVILAIVGAIVLRRLGKRSRLDSHPAAPAN